MYSEYKKQKLLEKNIKITPNCNFDWRSRNYMSHDVFLNYSYPFYIYSNKKNQQYSNDANSGMIFSLFNLDRSLGRYILSEIFNIERKLASLILEEVMNYNYDDFDKIINSPFSYLYKNYFLDVFPNLRTLIKNEGTEKSLKEYFEKKIMKSDKRKFNNKTEDFFLELSFGQLCNLYNFLGIDSRKRIANDFLRFNVNDIDCENFYETLYLLKGLRNLICHNRPIYNFNYKSTGNYGLDKRKKIISLYKKIYGKNVKEIKLMEIINLASFLNPTKSLLYDLCIDKIDIFLCEIPNIFSERIKKIINYI